jgi:iron-regulated transporter 1
MVHETEQYAKSAVAPWREYVASPVFLASFALSLLYLTVLSFGTTMVTYLLHTGFNPLQISGMRIGAVIAELSGTWVAPFITNRIGPIRSGLWFLNWQFGCLAAAVAAFAFLDNSSQLVAASLIVGVALSRIGLWGFDLSVQFLVQEVSNVSRLNLKFSTDNDRVSMNMRAPGSRPQKWPCRVYSSCSHSQQLSPFH